MGEGSLGWRRKDCFVEQQVLVSVYVERNHPLVALPWACFMSLESVRLRHRVGVVDVVEDVVVQLQYDLLVRSGHRVVHLAAARLLVVVRILRFVLQSRDCHGVFLVVELLV